MTEVCLEDMGHLDPVGLRETKLNAPQVFVDDYLVENRFDENMLSATVPHVAHRPQRLPDPILSPDRPWERELGIFCPSVVFDAREQLYRMYYSTYHRANRGKPDYPRGGYFLCYAESSDGIHWVKPDLGLYPWGDEKATNIIMQGDAEASAANVHVDNEQMDEEKGVKNIGTVPARFLRGHRFVMYYGDLGHYLATSEDGIHWQEKVHRVIANRIDCYQTMVYDEERDEFVTFLRNKLIFGGPRLPEGLRGNTRMIARLAGRDWWSVWNAIPTTVLIPDQGDAMRFYGMPTFRYGGIYWGLLYHFDEDPQTIEVELVFSRNGLDWHRLPGRPRLIPVGAPGTWDGGLVYAGDRMIERGDEWWLYYNGFKGYHDHEGNSTSIGVVRLRKEGFVSIRAGATQSYVVTRPLRWPGGRLLINAAAESGSVQVRVTDLRRNTIQGFEHADCDAFRGNAVRHRVGWKRADVADLAGKVIRLEFRFRNADLFSFVASG